MTVAFTPGTPPVDDVAGSPYPSIVGIAVEQTGYGLALFPTRGKIPLVRDWPHVATTDITAIATFLSNPGRPNYGMTCAPDCPRVLFAIDADGEEWKSRLHELEAEVGEPLPRDTKVTQTPSGGLHIFFEWPTSVSPGLTGDEFLGFTLRWLAGGRHFVIGPGSVIDGREYRDVGGDLIAVLPEAWARAALARGSRRLSVIEGGRLIEVQGGGYELPEVVPEGSRYGAIRDYVASRYNRGLSLDEMWAGVRDVIAPRFGKPLDDAGLRERFDRAIEGMTERLGPPAAAQRAPGPAAPVSDDDAVERLGIRMLTAFSTESPPDLLIGRLDPDGHTILYGTGGVGKGTLASWWAVQLVRQGSRVLIVDYENHPDEWARRIEGLGSPETRGEVAYVAPMTAAWTGPRGAIWQSAEELRTAARVVGADVIVIDSIVVACGGTDALKPEAASMYAGALQYLGIPVLSLAHVTKDGDLTYPFGSVFWHNLSRVTWSLARSGVDEQTVLVNRKHNNYARQSQVAVEVDWLDGVPRHIHEIPYQLALSDRIDAVLASGPLTASDITRELNDQLEEDGRAVKQAVVRQALKRGLEPARKRYTVTGTGAAAKWSRA